MQNDLLTKYEPLQWFLCYDAPYMLTPIITLINISPNYREDEIRETVQAYLEIYPRHLYNDLKIKADYDTWLDNHRHCFYATQNLQSKTKNYVQIHKETQKRLSNHS